MSDAWPLVISLPFFCSVYDGFPTTVWSGMPVNQHDSHAKTSVLVLAVDDYLFLVSISVAENPFCVSRGVPIPWKYGIDGPMDRETPTIFAYIVLQLEESFFLSSLLVGCQRFLPFPLNPFYKWQYLDMSHDHLLPNIRGGYSKRLATFSVVSDISKRTKTKPNWTKPSMVLEEREKNEAESILCF
ncbi:hypothetical protein Tco_0033521 [Tanacetum coccineum]